ncbi:hypothetical protein CCACVL1_07258 [Corchorus capsularis]|uniref:Uncharacterized protein n=1 Tax=Corchorus capsularis TaxID=210143 RepID=A0A1R3J7W1_COCAP|nr:hypothetical protein CCACVL1_07258 [Corchorus capsularis]
MKVAVLAETQQKRPWPESKFMS